MEMSYLTLVARVFERRIRLADRDERKTLLDCFFEFLRTLTREASSRGDLKMASGR